MSSVVTRLDRAIRQRRQQCGALGTTAVLVEIDENDADALLRLVRAVDAWVPDGTSKNRTAVVAAWCAVTREEQP